MSNHVSTAAALTVGTVVLAGDPATLDLLPPGSVVLNGGVAYTYRDADPDMRVGAGWSPGTNFRRSSAALAAAGPSVVLHNPQAPTAEHTLRDARAEAWQRAVDWFALLGPLNGHRRIDNTTLLEAQDANPFEDVGGTGANAA